MYTLYATQKLVKFPPSTRLWAGRGPHAREWHGTNHLALQFLTLILGIHTPLEAVFTATREFRLYMR